MDFSNKIVLVTGASRGIGRTVAQSFAERGARVVVHYNSNAAAAQETVQSLPGGPHMIVQTIPWPTYPMKTGKKAGSWSWTPI
jgi:NAD(P)-dependent dehydrogenase (short-subunit alcohol dehydrogenase family)